jgi:hypothetical protein
MRKHKHKIESQKCNKDLKSLWIIKQAVDLITKGEMEISEKININREDVNKTELELYEALKAFSIGDYQTAIKKIDILTGEHIPLYESLSKYFLSKV